MSSTTRRRNVGFPIPPQPPPPLLPSNVDIPGRRALPGQYENCESPSLTNGLVESNHKDADSSVVSLQAVCQRQHKQLETYVDKVKVKLDELQKINDRIEDLHRSATELLQNFGDEDARFRTEFKKQIESLERFKDQTLSIEALRNKLQNETGKVRDYEKRIESVQHMLESQKEKDSSWKARVSRRLRFLWGLIAVLVILWLLATAGSDGDVLSDALSDEEPIKLVPPAFPRREDDELEILLSPE